MKGKIPVLISLVVFLLLINNINAATSHTLQVKLKINNTVNKVYVPVPGIGEIASSTITNTSYASPSHYYLASYLDDVLLSLIFLYQEPISIDIEKSGNSHYLIINQSLTNSKTFLVFTKGDWTTIESRISLIEAGTFLLKIEPSFAHGLGLYNQIRVMLAYTDIDVQGDIKLQKGAHVLLIEGVGDLEGKHVINVSVV